MKLPKDFNPATGEDQLFLKLDKNQGAMPFPKHLWEKKKPEEPMLIIEPPTEEQLEADFKWRMLEYEMSQKSKATGLWPWIIAALFVWITIFLLKMYL